MPPLRSMPLSAAVLVAVAALAGCGKPEQDAYTAAPEAAPSSDVKTPAPAPPAWALAAMGQPLSTLIKGAVTCKGAVDLVVKHTGAKPGTVVAGWAWDEKDHQPVARVVFTDAESRVIGGADGALPRPDVPKAMPEVKTARVGWSGAARTTSGLITSVGLSAAGASCVIASRTL